MFNQNIWIFQWNNRILSGDTLDFSNIIFIHILNTSLSYN